MIQFEGYYVGSFHKVSDRPGDFWYSRSALLFLKDKRVLWATKYFKNQKISGFNMSDFKSNGYNGYTMSGNKISILKYKGHPILETKINMEIISKNKLKDSDEIMKFVSWEENKSL